MGRRNRNSFLAKRLRDLIPSPRTQFAAKIGVNYKALDSYLWGTNPPPEVLVRIASGLNMSVEALLGEALPDRRIPVVGRVTGGGLAAEAAGDEDQMTQRIEAAERGGAQTVRLTVAGLAITIIVAPASHHAGGRGKGG
jgi:hypothetical protein